MKLKTDTAAREIITAMRTMSADEILATFDLTEVVHVDLERFSEDEAYSQAVLEFVTR